MKNKPNAYLDIESTGLGKDDEIIQLGVIAETGEILINTMVKCQGDISSEAERIHGITKADLMDAPAWPTVHDILKRVLEGVNKVYIWNSDFDVRLIKQTSERYNLLLPTMKTVCVMNQFAKHLNNGYRRKLIDACDDLLIDTNNIQPHDAVSDCELTRRLHAQMKIEIAELNAKQEKRQKAKRSRETTKNKKMAYVPKNWREYPDFGQAMRPEGYRTLSSIPLREMNNYEFAGRCCSTFGGAGYLFKPKS